MKSLSVYFILCFRIISDAIDMKFSDESDDLAEEGISGPERTYRGPHINFPIQKKDLDILIDLFRKKKVKFRKINLFHVAFHFKLNISYKTIAR